jgi:hypothetical protein
MTKKPSVRRKTVKAFALTMGDGLVFNLVGGRFHLYRKKAEAELAKAEMQKLNRCNMKTVLI